MDTAKLIPEATSTTELTLFVPPAQGNTHCPEEVSAEQEDPGPAVGSYPAAKARDWKRVSEKPYWYRRFVIKNLSMIGNAATGDRLA